MVYREDDVLGYDSYQTQLDEARKKLTQMANPNMAQPQQTQPQATQSVAQPQSAQNIAQPQMTGRLVSYKDQAGNIQEIDEMYEKNGQLPQGWIKYSAPPTQPTQPTQVAPVQPQNAINPLQQQLADQKRKASISSLDYARQQALSGINTQRQALPKQTLATVGQARASADISARNLKEYMAQRFGTSISGAEGQGLMNIQTQRQGAESQANLNEQQALIDLGTKEADIGNKYAFDVASVEAGLQSQALQDEIDRQQRLELEARQDAIRQEGYNREDTLTAQELERKRQELARVEAINTIGRYGTDYTAEIERRKATEDTTDDALIPYLEDARNKKVTGLKETEKAKQEAQNKAQIDFEKAQYDRAMKIWEQTGVADQNVSAIIGVPVGTMTSDRRYKDAQLALDKVKASKTSSSTSNANKLTLNQALTQARLILGNEASAQEVQNFATQLQNGVITENSTPNKPTVKPPKADSSVKKVYDYLYKLEGARDLVGINAFINNKNNISELEGIINNPTSTDDEIETAKLILKQFSKYK